MRYAVGSMNPVKERAVQEAVGDQHTTVAVDADPGITAMPMDRGTAREGARNRAKDALAKTDAGCGVGIEGYVEADRFLAVWATIVDADGVLGEAGSGRARLPDAIAGRLPEEELGTVIEDVIGEEKIAQEEGTIAYLTGGRITRQEFTARAVWYALDAVDGAAVDL